MFWAAQLRELVHLEALERPHPASVQPVLQLRHRWRDGAKTHDDCPLQDMCEKIHATIRTNLAVMKKRYRGYAPGWHGPVHCSANRKDVMGGQQQQFRSWQVNLRGYLEVADAMNCKGYPSDAWEWATKPVPTQPAPR
jgi:hypothetical protein